MLRINLERWRTTPELFKDEDLSSFVLRLAPHGFLTVRELYHFYLGSPYSSLSTFPQQPDLISRMASMCGMDEKDITGRSWSVSAERKVTFKSRTMPLRWISERRRVAPGVLAADGDEAHARLAWRFPALLCDLRTGERLIANCPHCQQKLVWARVTRVFACQHCKHDLRTIAPSYASKDELDLARWLGGVLGLTESRVELSLPYPFDKLDFADSLEMLEWGAAFEGLLRRTHAGKRVANATMGIQPCLRWPAALELAVDMYLRNKRSRDQVNDFFAESLKGFPKPELRSLVMKQVEKMMSEPARKSSLNIWPVMHFGPDYIIER